MVEVIPIQSRGWMELSHKVKNLALPLFEVSAKDIDFLQPTFYHRGVGYVKTKTTVSSRKSIQENDPEFSTSRLVPGTNVNQKFWKDDVDYTLSEGHAIPFPAPGRPPDPMDQTSESSFQPIERITSQTGQRLPASRRLQMKGTHDFWQLHPTKSMLLFAQQIWSGNGLHIPPCKIKTGRYIGSRTELPSVFI